MKRTILFWVTSKHTYTALCLTKGRYVWKHSVLKHNHEVPEMVRNSGKSIYLRSWLNIMFCLP